MRSSVFLILGLIIGYLAYPYFHSSTVPQDSESPKRLKKIAQKKSTRRVEETEFHKSNEVSQPPINPAETITPEKQPETQISTENTVAFESIRRTPNKRKKVKQTLAEMFFSNSINAKAALELEKLPALPLTDSRIQKIQGTFLGKIRMTREQRVGALSNANLGITEKALSFIIRDDYDNEDEVSVKNRGPEGAFKSIPGDENLILIKLNESGGSYIVVNLKDYPQLNGYLYALNYRRGEFAIKKK